MRRFALVIALAATAASAQQNDWSINRTAGTAVMDEVSSLSFTVANAPTSRDNIQSFTLGIPGGPYDIDSASAPSGWRATNVDRRNRVVTFTANNACVVNGVGLRPGRSGVFVVRVIGVPNGTDQANQDLLHRRTDVVDVCNRGVSFRQHTGNATWTLVGLSARVATSVRTLALGDQVSLNLTITNQSTGTQSSIAPTPPTVTGTATFALVSGPVPALVNNLPQDGVTTFTWVYRATGPGAASFSTNARNASVSSPLVSTLDVSAGLFVATAIVRPAAVVSGGVVTVQVLPSNNSPTTITNVTPTLPLVSATGSASATQISGPSPSSVSSLISRSTTAFTTTWTIAGAPGDTITFSGGATALDGMLPITTNPTGTAVVTVQELTVTPTPATVLSAAGQTTIAYTLANGSSLPITSVVLMTMDGALFRTPTATLVPSGWTAASSSNPRGIRFTANSTSHLQPGASQTFRISYASIGAVTAPTPISQRAHVTFDDTTTARTAGTVTIAPLRTVPDVVIPVAVATPGRVHITWSNPTMHDGVLLLRAADKPPNTAPSPGARYPAGSTLGNATVVYEDGASFATSFADTGLTNGTTYYYRFYNRDEYNLYSPGNVPAPSPSNHLLVITPGKTSSDALWCTSMGMPALQQPYTNLGRAVYQANQGAFVTGSVITTGAPINGNELWRPSLTRGVVQARPTAMRVGGAPDPSIFVGDQLGYAYRLETTNGAITWTGNGGTPLGEVIQAQAVIAPRALANAAFKALYPTDLVFFATRNSSNRASNSVRALRADTGALAFTWQPGDLDHVTGAPVFDVATNTLWVASLRTAGPSLRVIDVLAPTGAPLLTVSDLGDIPSGVTRNGTVNQALVVDRTGVARGYDLATRTQAWQVNVGGTVTSPLVSYLDDFFVSTTTGVQRFHIDKTAGTASPVWASPTPLTLPTSVRVDSTNGMLFVGDGSGFLRRLDMETGAIDASVRVSTVGGVSMPSLDSTAELQRVYIGTADGRLCVYPTKF